MVGILPWLQCVKIIEIWTVYLEWYQGSIQYKDAILPV